MLVPTLRSIARACAFAATVGAAATPSTADETRSVASTPELRAALAAAKAGTTILLAPGDYAGFSIAGVRGAEKRPIVVRARDRASPPRFTGSVQLSACESLELEDLVFERFPGNGLNVDDGGVLERPARRIVLRRLVVRDCGGSGNEDGLKLSGVAQFRIDGCTVERWGRGGSAIDLVGCRDGEIVDCVFRDRAEKGAATGVQLKGGTRDVAVRRCRFEEAGERAVNVGGSTGRPWFRPKPEGFEAKAITVEECTFIGSLAPIAFVGIDGATVRANTIYLPRKWVARILQETQDEDFVPCRNGRFERNLVVYRAADVATAVNVGPKTAPETFQFARNYWYCVDAPQRSIPTLPVAESAPAGGADPRFLDAPGGDLRLSTGSPAKGYGANR